MREAIYPPLTANATFLDALAWCGVAWLSDKQHAVRQLLPELEAARRAHSLRAQQQRAQPRAERLGSLDRPWDYREKLEEAVLALADRGMTVSIYNHQLCTLPRSA